jgi:hypothetical protein
VIDSPRITEAARSGDGIGWHEHVHDVHDGCERFFRPGYNAHLLAEWLPALDGVVEKLQRGGRVADVGCGHGASTILMAQESRAQRSRALTTTAARSKPPGNGPRRQASQIGLTSRPSQRRRTAAMTMTW